MICIVKAMIFPVVTYGCESWTLKDWPQKNWCFELWCWRRLLKVSWTARKSNQSILKEINPEYSLGGLMLKWSCNTLATWCEEPTHWKRPWCWERLKSGGEWMTENEIVGWHLWLNGHESEPTLGDGVGLGSLACCSPWHHTTEGLDNNRDCRAMHFSRYIRYTE